jgi:hypothetical protein
MVIRGVVLPMLKLGPGWERLVNATPGNETQCPLHSREWVGPRACLNGYGERKISCPTGVRNPNCPACGNSLYRLKCPDPCIKERTAQL